MSVGSMEVKVLLLLVLVQGLWADVIVMKDITLGFGEALEQCREETHLTEDKMEDFFHIWRDDFKFEHREFGCALQCMSNHFNLLTPTSRMHHENTDQFIKSFPNGDILATRLVKIIHDCEQQFDAEEDHCWRILHLAECVKLSCQKDGLSPSMELMMAEFIMEVM